MEIYRKLEKEHFLGYIDREVFRKMLGKPLGAKRTTLWFVWRRDHLGKHETDLKGYHSYHFLYLKNGEWTLKTSVFRKAIEPVDIFEYKVTDLPEIASELLKHLMDMPKHAEDPIIFRMVTPVATPEENRVLGLFDQCSRYKEILKGHANRNAMSLGEKHDCGPFSVKFMLRPTFPIELVKPDDWQDAPPTHVTQAVCKTCKKCFLACAAQLFECFGPCHVDVDWQLMMRIVVRLYELHRNHCPSAPELTKLEVTRHPKERALVYAYRSDNFALRKKRTDETLIRNYNSRMLAGFARLSDAEEPQLGEIFDLQ